ncbi:hypothetical protein [Candidatus Rhodobacter oscarellae]|uniref:hypothetical protein n=1 Tax=Candidatus Rhodobacter oscarellae TaxID=1675527 RepID=UPI000AF53BE3|nr:hypothetical protein [Candidatus Rhodobacter lobularis]
MISNLIQRAFFACGLMLSAPLAHAEGSFSQIATQCALGYDIEISRNAESEIQRLSGRTDVDLIEFLLVFPETERSKVALAWLECLAPKFPDTPTGGINPTGTITGNNTNFPDLTNKTLTIETFIDSNGSNKELHPFSVIRFCNVDLNWPKQFMPGGRWQFSLRTENDSQIVKSYLGTNIPPRQTQVGPGNYYMIVASKNPGAGIVQMTVTTRCR